MQGFRGFVIAMAALLGAGAPAVAAPQHGIAMYGTPALPPDLVALPYVNPDAPKGGRIVFGETGGYDSLNPFVLKGRAPWGLRTHVYESLLGRSWDESFTLYGLLAESVETGPAREWVEFTLRPEARFSDGSPVTAEDVLWSVETLGREGHPRYRTAWEKVARAEITGPRSVRFTFNTADRELPLILGLRPILKKAQWAGRDFAEGGMEAPIGTGPYLIDKADPGRVLALKKDQNWWGAALPFNRGQHNFDEIRYEFFGDGAAVFEAFRGGLIDVYRERSAADWARAYAFPAVADGRILKAEIPHQRPTGIEGLAMNTRRAPFDNWRVREALILAFNFEFINATLNGGALPRITSYFANSDLAMRPGPAEGAVRDLLAPFAESLPPGTLEGYTLPASDGRPANRANLRAARALLDEAGFAVDGQGRLRRPDGAPFTFEILLRQGAAEQRKVADIYIEALERLGITATVRAVDPAQYTALTDVYDFDLTFYRRAVSLSPGNEQSLYWGRAGVERPGTGNWPGINSPAAEAMIAALLSAETREGFVAATRALDRVLTAGRYVIPIWHDPVSRLAHARRLHYPKTIPIYGDWVGFMPDIWWSEER